MQKLHLLLWKVGKESVFHIINEISWNRSSFGRRNSINWIGHLKSLDSALMKISIKGHN